MKNNLNDTRFLSIKADPNLWYWYAVKQNGFEYYEYKLCYVNDLLFIFHDQGIALRHIQAIFKLKGDKIEQPEINIRSQVRKMTVEGEEGRYM